MELFRNPQGKINAPTMAYHTVYGKYPEETLRGRTDAPKKMWRGNDVDENLEDKWLEDLNDLPVEIKSTDAGKDETRVAFVIFRMPEAKDDLYKEMGEKLKEYSDLYVSSDIGTEGRPRICIANNITPEDSNWTEWWNTLAGKIAEAYQKTISE